MRLGIVNVAAARRYLVAAIIAAIAMCSVLPGRTSADSGQVAPPAQASAAVAAEVQATGAAYAGDCASTESPQDLGAICSKFVAGQNGVYAFETGGTFSEFDHWVFVEQTGSNWQVVGTVALNDAMMTIPWPVAAPAPAPAG